MQVGCGSLSVDFLATVAAYPKPDDKIRTTTLKVNSSSSSFTFIVVFSKIYEAQTLLKLAVSRVGHVSVSPARHPHL
jgi:hypothetical protein